MGRAEAYLHGPVRRAYFARRIQADPVSRLAIWARRVAGFAVAKGGGLVATSSEYGAGVIVLAALAAVNLIRLQDQKQRK